MKFLWHFQTSTYHVPSTRTLENERELEMAVDVSVDEQKFFNYSRSVLCAKRDDFRSVISLHPRKQ